jgi:hypothetical protein
MATTKALELGQFGTDLTVDDSTGAVTIANDVTVNAATSTGIDDNADQTVITIDSNELVTLAGALDVNGTEILVGTSGSRFAENNLRFNATGSSYIDVATTGQSLNFRVSNASTHDTTALILSSDGNATFAGELRGPSLFIIDPSTYDTDSDAGSAAGTVRIRGDLIVDGDTTTINSTTLTVDDLNIVLASGAADSATADGAGITIDGADATLTWNDSLSSFSFNNNVDIPTGILNVNTTGTSGGGKLRVGGSIDITNTSGGSAFRIFDGVTFRGGVGDGNWTGTGDVKDFGIYVGSTLGSMPIHIGSSTPIASFTSTGLGIGTDDPATRLNVRAATNHTNGTDRTDLVTLHQGIAAWSVGRGAGIRWVGDTSRTMAGISTYVFGFEDTGLAFETGGANSTGNLNPTTRMVIDHDGKVGINNNDPDYRLDFGVGDTIRLRHTAAGTAIRVGASDYDVNLIRFDGASGITDSGYYGGSIRYMGSRASDANSLSIFMDNSLGTEVEALTIRQSGAIGIGTDSPQEKLEVNGVLQIRRDGDHPALRFAEINSGTSTTRGYIASGDWAVNGGLIDDFGISGSVTGDLLLATNAGTERLRIQNSTGNVGIGTNSPAYALDVRDGIVFAGRAISDAGSISYTNTAAVFSSRGVDQDASRTNVIRLMRDGTSGVQYAGVADFDMSEWESVGVSSRTQLTLNLGHGDLNSLETTDVMTWRSNGNVGIGTSSPGEKLDVNGVIRSLGNNNANYSTSLVGRYDSTHPMALYVRGNSATNSEILGVYADAGGANLRTVINPSNGWKVGIGTSDPNSNLHIKSTSDVKLTLETDEDSDCWINLSGATSEASIGYEPATNSLRFANAADGVTSNVRMTIDASGRVGIGTTDPEYKLDVVNDYRSHMFSTAGEGGHAVQDGVVETKGHSFALGGGGSVLISDSTVSSEDQWTAIFKGHWANNYEGGGLKQTPPVTVVSEGYPYINNGSTSVLVDIDPSTSRLRATNQNGSFAVHFTGTIEVFISAQGTMGNTAPIKTNGIQLKPNQNMGGSGGGTALGSYANGLILDTPLYKEYQYYWGGNNRTHTTTLTCGSYFMAEVVYVSNQTNSGGNSEGIHRYIRGKWANNHTSHNWVPFEDSGLTSAVSLTISATDNSAADSYGNAGPYSGRLTITEVVNNGSYSGTRLLVRVWYAGHNIYHDES